MFLFIFTPIWRKLVYVPVAVMANLLFCASWQVPSSASHICCAVVGIILCEFMKSRNCLSLTAPPSFVSLVVNKDRSSGVGARVSIDVWHANEFSSLLIQWTLVKKSDKDLHSVPPPVFLACKFGVCNIHTAWSQHTYHSPYEEWVHSSIITSYPG